MSGLKSPTRPCQPWKKAGPPQSCTEDKGETPTAEHLQPQQPSESASSGSPSEHVWTPFREFHKRKESPALESLITLSHVWQLDSGQFHPLKIPVAVAIGFMSHGRWCQNVIRRTTCPRSLVPKPWSAGPNSCSHEEGESQHLFQGWRCLSSQSWRAMGFLRQRKDNVLQLDSRTSLMLWSRFHMLWPHPNLYEVGRTPFWPS